MLIGGDQTPKWFPLISKGDIDDIMHNVVIFDGKLLNKYGNIVIT